MQAEVQRTAGAPRERPIIMSGPMVSAILAGRKTQTRRALRPSARNRRPIRIGDGPLVPGLPADYAFADAIEWRLESEIGLSMAEPGEWAARVGGSGRGTWTYRERCPYGVPGDRLWLREAWRTSVAVDHKPPGILETPGNGYGWPIWYGADGGAVTWRGARAGGPGFITSGRYRHARFMPRWASRLTLEVVEVRVQRLQEITAEDAIAEGLAKITKDGGQTWKYGIPDRDGLPGSDDHGWPWRDWDVDPRVAFERGWNAINAKRGYEWGSDPWVWAVTFRRVEEALDA